MTNFFISYTQVDRPWAEWIAWQLEAAGYTTVIQAWDFRPGGNFVLDMQQAATISERTIAVLSPAYLQSGFTAAEWASAFKSDPTGTAGPLLPVRIQDCELRGLLLQIVYIDLVGLEEERARDTLLAGVRQQRAKPTKAPRFPGHSPRSVTEPPLFPGSIPQNIPCKRLLDARTSPGRTSRLDDSPDHYFSALIDHIYNHTEGLDPEQRREAVLLLLKAHRLVHVGAVRSGTTDRSDALTFQVKPLRKSVDDAFDGAEKLL